MKLRPTKGLVGFLAVLLASLAPAALTNSSVGYLPCLTLLFCALLSLAHLLLIKDRLQCRARAARTVLTRGEEIPFLTEVENGSRLPVPNLKVQFFLSGGDGRDDHVYPLQLTLSPRERRSFSLTASFTHIGVYEAGLRQVVLTDLLGIVQAVSRAEDRRRMEIQPRLLDMERLPVSERQTVENDRARTASPLSGMDYVGVRDYAYGDPIKTIQWKLSAHAGSLMTKQMESYTNSGLAVVMDFSVPACGRETMLELADSVAEAGAAAGQWAVRSGMDCQLLLLGEDSRPHWCTPASFRDLGPWLHCMRPREGGSPEVLADVLRKECGGSHGQSNVLLCTADLNEDVLAALRDLKQSRRNPVLFLILPDALDEARRKELLARMARLQYAGIPCRAGRDAAEVIA